MEEIVVIAVCLTFNALFAAYEMAFVSVPRPELRRLARSGNKDAERLLSLRENPERTLSIIQIGITLVGAISAAVGGAGASESLEPFFQSRFSMSENSAEFLSIAIVVLPLTYLSVVIGELVPKSLALKNPVKIVFFGSRPLLIADRILSPAVTLLEWSTRQVLHVFFPRSKGTSPIPETSLEIDSLPQHHQQAVLNLAHIETRKIKDIMVPWKEVNCVRSTDTMDDVVPVIFASGHTRLPMISDSDVVGILHTKEFLAYRETGGKEWISTVRPALRIFPHDSVLATLRLMQSKRNHMAIIFSTSGERLGMVTLEDISEEIWGDIFDEDDDSRIRKVFADRVKTKMRPPEF